MAKDKPSALIYCDNLPAIEKLVKNDRENGTNNAGELFLHFLQFINDKDPVPINFVVDISFEPIKQSLKRDLVKWENRASKSRENGAKGGRPPGKKKKVPAAPVDPKFNFRKSLERYGFDKDLVDQWLQVRKGKKLANTEVAYNDFITEVEKSGLEINELLKDCIIKSWGGFKNKWLTNTGNNGTTEKKSTVGAVSDYISRNAKHQE